MNKIQRSVVVVLEGWCKIGRLLEVYILAAPKVISGPVTTFGSKH